MLARLFRSAADPRSGLRLVLMRATRGRSRGARPRRAVAIRVKALGGHPLLMRPGTNDVDAFSDNALDGFHLPPAEIRGDALIRIVEVGTNIGVGLAALAHRYPAARLVGLEADRDNALLARRNTSPWSDRCTVIEAAAWDSETQLTLEGDETNGYHVRERTGDDPEDSPTILAMTLDGVLAEHMPEGEIDYVLLSAEHSEARLLRAGGGWAPRVRAIKVETYNDGSYTPADTTRDLERLGFSASVEPGPWGGCAIGVRAAPPDASRRGDSNP